MKSFGVVGHVFTLYGYYSGSKIYKFILKVVRSKKIKKKPIRKPLSGMSLFTKAFGAVSIKLLFALRPVSSRRSTCVTMRVAVR